MNSPLVQYFLKIGVLFHDSRHGLIENYTFLLCLIALFKKNRNHYGFFTSFLSLFTPNKINYRAYQY